MRSHDRHICSPAVAFVQRYGEERNISLIWICRDAYMVRWRPWPFPCRRHAARHSCDGCARVGPPVMLRRAALANDAAVGQRRL